MDVIAAREVQKLYGSHRALDGVTLTVKEGALFGFLGPNGAGKSTTMRILMGMIQANGGRMEVFGLDPWTDGPAVRARVGFLPTDPGIPKRMTGTQALEYFSRLDGVPAVLRDRTCDALRLSAADLARPVGAYSRGMRQKVAIVQALQHDPDLLVLDEPTEGLDPLVQEGFFDLLRERNSAGRTIFFSSHILSEVDALCDDIAIIRSGKIVDTGTVKELRGGHPRRVTVRLAPGAEPPPTPDGCTLRQSTPPVWEWDHTGEIAPLLRSLAELAPVDLTIVEPSLDEVFMGYYTGERG